MPTHLSTMQKMFLLKLSGLPPAFHASMQYDHLPYHTLVIHSWSGVSLWAERWQLN